MFHYKRILQYFFQGILILGPIAITAYAIWFVITSIDSWIPIFSYVDEQGVQHVQNYGVGFLLIIIFPIKLFRKL